MMRMTCAHGMRAVRRLPVAQDSMELKKRKDGAAVALVQRRTFRNKHIIILCAEARSPADTCIWAGLSARLGATRRRQRAGHEEAAGCSCPPPPADPVPTRLGVEWGLG